MLGLLAFRLHGFPSLGDPGGKVGEGLGICRECLLKIGEIDGGLLGVLACNRKGCTARAGTEGLHLDTGLYGGLLYSIQGKHDLLRALEHLGGLKAYANAQNLIRHDVSLMGGLFSLEIRCPQHQFLHREAVDLFECLVERFGK